ncbi:hypothetical protein IJG14_08515 [bacterium]|nr:hypothetical protein [bacterium]
MGINFNINGKDRTDASLDKIKKAAEELNTNGATLLDKDSIFNTMQQYNTNTRATFNYDMRKFNSLMQLGVNGTVSVDDIANNMASGAGEDVKNQYTLFMNLLDTDGDGQISQDEYNVLNELDGKDGDISIDDINAFIDAAVADLGLDSEEGITNLLNDIDGILKEDTTADTSTAPRSGDQWNITKNDDGTYTAKVEDFQPGKAITMADGTKRYPNGSAWGIVANAYPDLSQSDYEAVYKMIDELNGFENPGIGEGHLLKTGDEIKLPVLEFKDGKLVGKTDTAAEEEFYTDRPINGNEHGTMYETKNEDGTYTQRWEDKNGMVSVTQLDANHNKTESVTYSDKDQKNMVSKYIYNEKGDVSESYEYNKDGKITQKVTMQYDENGNHTGAIRENKEYNDAGKTTKQTITECDANGKKTKTTETTYKDGNFTGMWVQDKVTTTQFNNNGTKTVTTEQCNLYGVKTGEKTVQIYNSKGDITSEVKHSADGSYTVTEYHDGVKITTKYDKDGNPIDEDGNAVDDASAAETRECTYSLDTQYTYLCDELDNGIDDFIGVIDDFGINIKDFIDKYDEENETSFLEVLGSKKLVKDDINKVMDKIAEAYGGKDTEKFKNYINEEINKVLKALEDNPNDSVAANTRDMLVKWGILTWDKDKNKFVVNEQF